MMPPSAGGVVRMTEALLAGVVGEAPLWAWNSPNTFAGVCTEPSFTGSGLANATVVVMGCDRNCEAAPSAQAGEEDFAAPRTQRASGDAGLSRVVSTRCLRAVRIAAAVAASF